MNVIMNVIILFSMIRLTLGVNLQVASITCASDSKPNANKYDEPVTWYNNAYFFNGMIAEYSSRQHDRIFSLQYCAPESNSDAVEARELKDSQTLPYTDYKSYWIRGCGGGSALYSAYSIHKNSAEDRTFEFKCDVPEDTYILGSCNWSEYYADEWYGDLDFNCENNGIIRTIKSFSDKEDRKYSFECCNVYNNPYDYIPMQCDRSDAYSNEFDEPHASKANDEFLSGLYSIHNNDHEDRRFKWTYCKQDEDNDVSASYITAVESDQGEATGYDLEWEVNCGEHEQGASAMIGAVSTHSNSKEDRTWTFTCGVLDKNKYELVNCGWSGYLNTYDGVVDFNCPNNGIIRGIWSRHDNDREDRLWRFDCCVIAQTTYTFTNLIGKWEKIAGPIGTGQISQSTTTGVSTTNSQSVTQTFSTSFTESISQGYNYLIGSMSYTMSMTVGQSTAQTISSSVTQEQQTTIQIKCEMGVQYLYQFLMTSNEAMVATNQYRCTNVADPECAPEYFDCDYINGNIDPNCNQCKDEWYQEIEEMNNE